MALRTALAVLGSGLMLLLGACSEEPRTEILVVVDSDLSVPSDLSQVRFEVTGPDDEQQISMGELSQPSDLPLILGLLHEGGPLGAFRVAAIGSNGLRRDAVVSFVRDKTVVLRMDLVRECVDVVCGDAETCGTGGCRAAAVGKDELEPWTGEPPRLDAGLVPIDGGPDAATGFDSGPRDGSTGSDSGMTDGGALDGGALDGRAPDAGCTSNADCDDGIACTDDLCSVGACSSEANDSNCDPGRVCIPGRGCECDGDGDCDDGAFCNGMETCVSGACRAGTAPPCGDGVACTRDRCDDLLAACVHTEDDTLCVDAIDCTVNICNAAMGGCTFPTSDALCNDSIGCTVDTCDWMTGCVFSPDSGMCSGGELCSTASDCVVPPSFTDIYNTILSVECSDCHTMGPSFSGGLDMSNRMKAYMNLVSASARCPSGNTLVIPWDAANSLLWRKLEGVNLCRARMPLGRTPLPAAQIDTIRDWINAGAPDN